MNVDQAFVQLAQHIFDHYKVYLKVPYNPITYSFQLARKPADIASDEIKLMETHGIKFGPQKPILNILPSGAGGSNQDNGCC